jgi:hypothetical protein
MWRILLFVMGASAERLYLNSKTVTTKEIEQLGLHHKQLELQSTHRLTTTTFRTAFINIDDIPTEVIVDTGSSDMVIQGAFELKNPISIDYESLSTMVQPKNSTIEIGKKKWVQTVGQTNDKLPVNIWGVGFRDLSELNGTHPFDVFTYSTRMVHLNHVSYESFVGEPVYLPIVDDQTYWKTTIRKVAVEGKDLEIQKGIVIFDTGTSVIKGPFDSILLLVSILNTYADSSSICSIEDYPTLQFDFDTIRFELEPFFYMKGCTPLFAANAEGEWIMGDPFFRKFTTIFNVKKKQMGFAVSKEANLYLRKHTEYGPYEIKNTSTLDRARVRALKEMTENQKKISLEKNKMKNRA